MKLTDEEREERRRAWSGEPIPDRFLLPDELAGQVIGGVLVKGRILGWGSRNSEPNFLVQDVQGGGLRSLTASQLAQLAERTA